MKLYDVCDREYNQRVKCAEATNLVVDKPEDDYVPLDMYCGLYAMLERVQIKSEYEEIDLGDDFREEIKAYLEYMRGRYNNERIRLNFVPDPVETKPEVDVCPYCGNKMFITSQNRDSMIRNYRPINGPQQINGDIYFNCPACGARSPWIRYSPELLDRERVKQEMAFTIEDATVNYEDNDTEDND